MLPFLFHRDTAGQGQNPDNSPRKMEESCCMAFPTHREMQSIHHVSGFLSGYPVSCHLPNAAIFCYSIIVHFVHLKKVPVDHKDMSIYLIWESYHATSRTRLRLYTTVP